MIPRYSPFVLNTWIAGRRTLESLGFTVSSVPAANQTIFKDVLRVVETTKESTSCRPSTPGAVSIRELGSQESSQTSPLSSPLIASDPDQVCTAFDVGNLRSKNYYDVAIRRGPTKFPKRLPLDLERRQFPTYVLKCTLKNKETIYRD